MNLFLSWRNYFIYLILFVSAVLFIRFFFITPYKVVTDALSPAVISGDYIFLNRLSRLKDFFDRGDYVGFRRNNLSHLELGRIIARPGDFAEVVNGQLYVNEKKQKEIFSKELNYGPIVVAQQSYLVLQDIDSSNPIKLLNQLEIEDVAFLVWFSVDQKEVIAESSWTKIRWHRFRFL